MMPLGPRKPGAAVAVLFALACDPAVGTTVRLTPSPSPAASIAMRGGAMREAALEAVGRVARDFGLDAVSEAETSCDREWLFRGSRTQTGLAICATLRGPDEVELSIGEFITRRWSPRGDSLRRTVGDTLARYGTVVILNPRS